MTETFLRLYEVFFLLVSKQKLIAKDTFAINGNADIYASLVVTYEIT